MLRKPDGSEMCSGEKEATTALKQIRGFGRERRE